MTQLATDPIRHAFSTMIAWFTREWDAKSQANMLKAMGQNEIDQIARDCGITAGQLLAFAEADPRGADEMPRMMRALNIDPMEVELQMSRRYRDMQINCINCGSKSHCRKDLVEDRAAEEYQSYCGNSQTLNALRAKPELLLDA